MTMFGDSPGDIDFEDDGSVFVEQLATIRHCDDSTAIGPEYLIVVDGAVKVAEEDVFDKTDSEYMVEGMNMERRTVTIELERAQKSGAPKRPNRVGARDRLKIDKFKGRCDHGTNALTEGDGEPRPHSVLVRHSPMCRSPLLWHLTDKSELYSILSGASRLNYAEGRVVLLIELCVAKKFLAIQLGGLTITRKRKPRLNNLNATTSPRYPMPKTTITIVHVCGQWECQGLIISGFQMERSLLTESVEWDGRTNEEIWPLDSTRFEWECEDLSPSFLDPFAYQCSCASYQWYRHLEEWRWFCHWMSPDARRPPSGNSVLPDNTRAYSDEFCTGMASVHVPEKANTWHKAKRQHLTSPALESLRIPRRIDWKQSALWNLMRLPRKVYAPIYPVCSYLFFSWEHYHHQFSLLDDLCGAICGF
ncbi:hypothetical protein BXZ70DRAFT_907481 [Cristinia sonorae]|uniref:Uncharacterized protein n=1 Tax=Cristinia sonorae TaxID=1940300 RepID=A0A8K0XPT6_9AGAR|nr:hypothetical protein BXZ70DRAFT_907481 [Cristinia sonorae]